MKCVAVIISLLLLGAWLPFGAPFGVIFNSGAITNGIMMWAPYGSTNSACAPSCYTSPSVASVLPSGKTAVISGDSVGTVRQGFDPSSFLVNPGQAATYWPQAFQQFTAWTNAGLKIIINNAPNPNNSDGWTPDQIMDGGHTSTKFLAYVSFLQSEANYIAANPTLCPSLTCAIGLFNELPFTGNVTGGATEIYAMTVQMWQAVRTILPKHTINVCAVSSSGSACDPINVGSFAGFHASDFDGNTIYTFHAYVPPVAAWACEPLTIWRDVCNITYPPTNSSADYNVAKAAYLTALAADNTWASDCPSGSNCTAARAANQAEIINNFTYEGLTCYYGQGGGGSTSVCPAGQQENQTYIQNNFLSLIESWRTTVAVNWKTNQVMMEEWGFSGTGPNGVGLTGAAQAAAIGDYKTSINHYGYHSIILEVSYSNSQNAGSAFGLFNQNSPYATINAAAITALGFNGQ